jgi:hypothetical protein
MIVSRSLDPYLHRILPAKTTSWTLNTTSKSSGLAIFGQDTKRQDAIITWLVRFRRGSFIRFDLDTRV